MSEDPDPRGPDDADEGWPDVEPHHVEELRELADEAIERRTEFDEDRDDD